jgi:hypothetical protein
MARIIVAGYMVRHPVAGNLLAFFQYVLGLHRLGHELFYIEESGWPGSCYDPTKSVQSDDPSYGLRTVRALATEYGLKIPFCYINRDSGSVDGAAWQDIKRELQRADLLLNVGGVCWLEEFLLCRRRALIDMDPFFAQIGRFGMDGFSDHQVYFSYGMNIGRPGCGIPVGRTDWISSVPPVMPELWSGIEPVHEVQGKSAERNVLTTIANWKAYGAVTYKGERYGQKDEEFLKVIDLPRHTSQRLELAVSGIGPGLTEQLRSAGWLVRGATELSSSVSAYRQYIARSRGEFSVAKNAYVKTHSGWFSDRSVCYLASGRPVLVQDTGIGDCLPTGEGLLTFRDIPEALSGIESINAGYEKHCRAAQALAAEYFAAEVVLPRLLNAALN